MAGLCRAGWRLTLALTHLVHGLLVCALQFPFLDEAARLQRVRWWCAGMLNKLGLSVAVFGAPQACPVLVVANHVSWLDILVINAVQPVRFVSKAEVRAWPVLGWLVACGGTLFVVRERRRDALRLVHEVAKALASGQTVAVFPEGTTGDGHTMLPFHANVLQAALTAGVPVQPMALRYSDATSAVSAAAAYVGDTTLAESVWRVASARRLAARIELMPAEVCDSSADRRALGERLRDRIGSALNRPAQPSP